jgi:hypothetical protein
LPAIVIPAYNRPLTLARLLDSLQVATYPAGQIIPLVISIDPQIEGPNRGVRKAAESFHWQHGPMEIICHTHHLGLLNNFYFCGDLSERYGSVIFLEDDSTVSPVFYHYVSQALEFFKVDPQVAGISLYRYPLNGYTHLHFEPLSDASDVFFMQLSSIVGQAWTASQWKNFRDWLDSGRSAGRHDALHEIWSEFDADDHFPILTDFLVSTGCYYVFPRISLTTGFGNAGTHFTRGTSYFQVPLQYQKSSFQFHDLRSSNAVYDSFMEILPDRLKRLVPHLNEFDFDVDLNATKSAHHLKADYVITTRPCKNPIRSFALAMHPPEANIISRLEGQGIYVSRRAEVTRSRWKDLQKQKILHDYHSRGRRSFRQRVLYFILDLLQRLAR